MSIPTANDYGKTTGIPMAAIGGLLGAPIGLTAGNVYRFAGGNRFAPGLGLGLGAGLGALTLGGLGYGLGAIEGGAMNNAIGDKGGYIPLITGGAGMGLGVKGATALANRAALKGKARLLAQIIGATSGIGAGWGLGGALNKHLPDSLNNPIEGAMIGGGLGTAASFIPALMGKAPRFSTAATLVPTALGAVIGAMNNKY